MRPSAFRSREGLNSALIPLGGCKSTNARFHPSKTIRLLISSTNLEYAPRLAHMSETRREPTDDDSAKRVLRRACLALKTVPDSSGLARRARSATMIRLIRQIVGDEEPNPFEFCAKNLAQRVAGYSTSSTTAIANILAFRLDAASRDARGVGKSFGVSVRAFAICKTCPLKLRRALSKRRPVVSELTAEASLLGNKFESARGKPARFFAPYEGVLATAGRTSIVRRSATIPPRDALLG